jgi:ribonuclease-3
VWGSIRIFFQSLFKSDNEAQKFKNSILTMTNFEPINISLYRQALDHKANERLEFLGDSILSCVVSDYLFKSYSAKNEGFLTLIRSRITNRNMLNNLSKAMGLDKLIRYDKSNGGDFIYLYGDALEAFLGAVYLDKGYAVCYKFIIDSIISKYIDLENLINFDDNYKGKIIEWSQREGKTVTFESEIHGKGFLIKLYIDDKFVSEGLGNNKKVASQMAAKKACELLLVNGDK